MALNQDELKALRYAILSSINDINTKLAGYQQFEALYPALCKVRQTLESLRPRVDKMLGLEFKVEDEQTDQHI